MAAKHVPQVAALEKQSFNHPWAEELFLAETINPQALPLVALDHEGGRVLGYIIIWLAADQAEVQNIAIAPDYRGKGLGRALLQCGLKLALQNGACQAFLEVRPSNKSARSLYESLGFKQVGLRRKYYRPDGEDALVLAIDL